MRDGVPGSSWRARLCVLAALSCVTGVLATPACHEHEVEKEQPRPRVQLKPENIARARQTDLEVGPELSGTLEADERATIVAEVPGSVRSVRAELGQKVEKGDLLARIESNALSQALNAAQASLAAARAARATQERQTQRVERLVKAGALAERELDDAELALSSAQAQVEQASAQLSAAREQVSNARVVAPLSGVVSEQLVHAGDVVTSGSRLFVILDPSSMRLQASLAPDAISKIHVGRDVVFRVHGYPERSFNGSIERIAPAADPATRQIQVVASIPNPDASLIAGLFAEGHVQSEKTSALVVPTNALNTRGDRTTVLRVKRGQIEEVNVVTGVKDEKRDLVAVTSGLKQGDVVVVGTTELVPGTPVELPAEPAARR